MGTPAQWYEPQQQTGTADLEQQGAASHQKLADFLSRQQSAQQPNVNPQQVMQDGGSNPYAQAQQTIANVPTPQPLTPANNQQTATPTRGGMIKNVLRNFLYYGGQAAMKEAGLPTDVELAQIHSQNALRGAQAQLAQAQASTFSNTVQTPLGPMPAVTWQKLGPAYLQSQGRAQGAQIGATAKSQASMNQLRGVLAKGGFDLQQDEDGTITGVKPLAELSAVQQAQVDLQKAHADVLTNPNNPTYQQKEREIQARLAMAQANLNLRQRGQNRADAQFGINNNVLPDGSAPQVLSPNQPTDANGNPVGMAQARFGLQQEKATPEYKFATALSTQNTIKYLNSLTGSNGNPGNLDTLIGLSDKIQRTNYPALNDAAAWARLQSGDPQIASYRAAVTEVADQVGKILQGGGSGAGTSDAKLHQAMDMFNTGFSPDQMRAVATTLRDLLANRKRELIGGNPYLTGQQAFQNGLNRAKAGSNPRQSPMPTPATADPFASLGGKAR